MLFDEKNYLPRYDSVLNRAMGDRDEFVSQLDDVTGDVWEADLVVVWRWRPFYHQWGEFVQSTQTAFRFKRVISVLYDLSDDDAALIDDYDSLHCLGMIIHPSIKTTEVADWRSKLAEDAEE